MSASTANESAQTAKETKAGRFSRTKKSWYCKTNTAGKSWRGTSPWSQSENETDRPQKPQELQTRNIRRRYSTEG